MRTRTVVAAVIATAILVATQAQVQAQTFRVSVTTTRTWVVNTNWDEVYQPDEPFEVGKMYFHPYSAQFYVHSALCALDGTELLVIEMIKGQFFNSCPRITDGDSTPVICGIQNGPRMTWMEMTEILPSHSTHP